MDDQQRAHADIASNLSRLSLPEPSAVTEASNRHAEKELLRTLNDHLARLDFQEPSAISKQDFEDSRKRQREALYQAIAALELGEPEQVTRANARADGRRTPGRIPRSEASPIVSPTSPSSQIDFGSLMSPTASNQGMDIHRAASLHPPVHSVAAATASSKDTAASKQAAEDDAWSEESDDEASAEPSATTNAEQKITPWDVQGAIVDGKPVAIDYNKLVRDWGAHLLDEAILDRFQKLIGRPLHPFLKRKLFFSHRDLNTILDRYEQGKPFYLYTGRGPSSGSMHLGHAVPFTFTAWLQEVFDCPLVIQMTDDEKFLRKKTLTYDEMRKYTRENVMDIIANGFNPEKTFIFSDFDYMGGQFYLNTVKAARAITLNQSRATFGLSKSDNIGLFHFVAVQTAPAFSNSFKQIFGKDGNIPALIPCAIDQDPYFRLTRSIATSLKYKRPALMHARFLSALQGPSSKMSASEAIGTIYMTDTPNQIKNKINKYAFSGGQETVEQHRLLGGNPDVDISYEYLSFFMDDDARLEQIAADYRSGKLLTGELKQITIEFIQNYVAKFQERRAAVTEEVVDRFMDPNRKIEPTIGKAAASATAATATN